MQLFASLLGCLALPRVAGLSFRSDAAAERPLAFDVKNAQQHDLQVMLHSMSNCVADPGCKDLGNHSQYVADVAKNNTINQVNATQTELELIISELKACKFEDDTAFMSSFNDRVTSHTACRGRQVTANDLHKACLSLLTSQTALKTSTCTGGIMGQSPSDLVGICRPGPGVPVGSWLESMKTTFEDKHKEWLVEEKKCTEATGQVANTTTRCSVLAGELASVVTSCDDELSAVESFACASASGGSGRCSGYEACYNSAIARYNAKVAEIPSLVKSLKDAYVAAEQMTCFSKAVGAAGDVDTTKAEACRNASLVDTSSVKVTIPLPPARQSCPDPVIFPGSLEYKTRLYSGLPAGIDIRDPTLCLGWKGGCAARSTFDKSIVLLKYAGKYCKVQATGNIACSGERGQFEFVQESTSTCLGQVRLLRQPSGEACRYDPLASLPGLSCGERPVVGKPAFTAALSSNPLALSRHGSVTLSFAGTSLKPMSLFQKLPKNRLDEYFHAECFKDGKRGAFRGVSSVHNNGAEDREFEWNCAFPSDGISGFVDANWFGWTNWDANWQLECGSNEVITHVEARHDNWREDRQYNVMCGKIPQGTSLDATSWTGWTNRYDEPSSWDCGGDGVLVGIKSENNDGARDRIWAYRCATLSMKAPPQLSFDVEFLAQESDACKAFALYRDPTWFFLDHGLGTAVQCGKEANTLACASTDGVNCQWGGYGGYSPNAVIPSSAVESKNGHTRMLTTRCPGWVPKDGSDACKTFGCYVGDKCKP